MGASRPIPSVAEASGEECNLPERVTTRHGGGLSMLPVCLSIHPAALDGLDLDSIVRAKHETGDKGGSSLLRGRCIGAGFQPAGVVASCRHLEFGRYE